MKCPVCGDAIQNGRCVFCGYRPTKADQEAAERYARQKASLAGGPETKPLRRTKSVPATASRASPKPVKISERAKPASKSPAKAPEKAKPSPKPKSKPKQASQDDAGQRPGRLKRLLFKLIVIAWFALYIGLIAGQLIQNMRQAAPEAPDVQVTDDTGDVRD